MPKQKGNGFRILKDSLRDLLGFPTKYESVDRSIRQQNLQAENDLKYIMAQRNIMISKIEATINFYNKYIQIYDKFRDYYNNIMNEADKDIIKSNSDINITLYKLDGTKFATANYTVLSELIGSCKDPEIVPYLAKQLEEKHVIILKDYVNLNIQGQGIAQLGNNQVKNHDIYTNYLLIKQMVNNNLLMDKDNNVICNNINGFEDLEMLKNNVDCCYREIQLIMNRYLFQLNNLKNLQATDKNAIEQIELSRKLLQTSPEYVAAKASQDYLEGINKLKR